MTRMGIHSTDHSALSPGTRCLVTGGAGFIGSHLVEALVARGHPVRVVDNLSTGHASNLDGVRDRIDFQLGDLTDPEVCDNAVRGIDLVFHVAALPSVPRSMIDPWASHDANVNATVRLVEASRRGAVQRIVYSSSSSVYGDTATLPKTETAEPLPRSPYAAAKLAGEQYVLALGRAGAFTAVALRYFNVFGPRQDPHSAYAAAIPAFLRAALEGEAVKLFGDGRQTRDFTYVENVVHGNLLAAAQPAPIVNGVVTNIGSGTRTSLRSLLGLVRQITGRGLDIHTLPRRTGDVRHSLASLERASDLLGYRCQVSLEEGLDKTWRWFQTARRARRAPAAVASRPA